jgi:hypothetical protein
VTHIVCHRVATVLDLEVDLLFFDTTSTYFEVDEEDELVPRDKNGNLADDAGKAAGGKPAGFRAYGKSKDHRDDLPPVVIGLAVTRGGIPVRVWCWPMPTIAFGERQQACGEQQLRQGRGRSPVCVSRVTTLLPGSQARTGA